MLAGNKLLNLPESLINCNNLELLRISANQINSIPYWIFSLPKLSWIALAGNPITTNNNVNTNIRIISWKDITIKEILGEGASGIVYKAILHENDQDVDVAVKIYKGMATSDGLPEDEMKTAEIVGDHPNSIQVIGRLTEIPDNKQGLVLSLIPSTYITLGNPPSFDTVTRDVYNPNLRLSLEVVLEILLGVSSLSSHLHSKYISHGDLYAHNILVDISTGHTLLGDFGASTNYYHMITINNNHDIDIARGMQGIEVRAFGYLAEELISLLIEDANVTDRQIIINDLNALVEQCLCTNVFLRPLFSDINRKLSSLKDLFLSIEKRQL